MMSSQDARVPRIFDGRDEAINLLLPVVFLFLTLLSFLAPFPFWSFFGKSAPLYRDLLSDIIFLNITHNAFTVMMILSFPELRPWIQAQNLGAEKKFWLKTTALFAVLALFFFASLMSKSSWLYELGFFMTLIFPIHHSISQSLGLSLLYNQPSADSPHDVRSAELRERRLTTLYIWLIILALVIYLGPKHVDWLNSISNLEFMNRKYWVGSAIVLGLLVPVSMFFYPPVLRKKKFFFSLRYPLWALSIFSPVAVFASKAIHGVEYFLVVRKMSRRSKFQKWSYLSIWILGIVIGFALLRLLYFSLQSNQADGDISPWLTFVASISIAFSFLHYYLDRELFLMRRKTNAETVGKLLR